MEYDFSGWATRNDLTCSDGLTIRRDAFKDNDGKVVPLVWNHQHNEIGNVLGHALLENRNDGVYAYCSLNETQAGQDAKTVIKHGDIVGLSIYANKLKKHGSDVVHGAIREVSLVLAGANPGAFIDSMLMHGEESDEEAIIYTGEDIYIEHSESDSSSNDDKGSVESSGQSKEDESVSEGETVQDVLDTFNDKQKNVMYYMIGKALEDGNVEHSDIDIVIPEDETTLAHSDENNDSASNETVEDVFNTLSEKQKDVVYFMIGKALEDAGIEHSDIDDEDENSEGGNETMKHNVFDKEETRETDVLSHADQGMILEFAKKPGMTFQTALEMYADENNLQHDAVSSGFAQDTSDGNVTWLFPEYKDVRPGAPELITNDQGWVGTVMNKVHKSPISRIRTSQVDIRNIDDLRAQGYVKGKEKKQTGNFKLVRRTTDPQTVYVKSALHRDDIVDITDFDYVQYLYNIDRMNLNEELATAIMIGDGRTDGTEGKIEAEHIRPIWLDDDLYTIHVDLDKDTVAKELQGEDTQTYFGDNFVTAEAMVNTVLYARENFKGTGTPDMFITPHMLNVMLLARDRNGHRIYSSKAELATALNVGAIHTAEQFEGKQRTDAESNTKNLLALIVNLADYSLGATKGGEVTHFTQFDIDFNQQKSLLETRCSGALTRVYSAIAIEEPVTEG